MGNALPLLTGASLAKNRVSTALLTVSESTGSLRTCAACKDATAAALLLGAGQGAPGCPAGTLTSAWKRASDRPVLAPPFSASAALRRSAFGGILTTGACCQELSSKIAAS